MSIPTPLLITSWTATRWVVYVAHCKRSSLPQDSSPARFHALARKLGGIATPPPPPQTPPGSEQVAALVGAGASVDACTAKQETPLLQACQYGHVSIVQLLLDSRARLAQLDSNVAPVALELTPLWPCEILTQNRRL